MKKHSVFAAAVILAIVVAAGQAMRADGVPSEPMALGQLVSPFDLMQNAHDLPVVRIDNAV
jgi:hypothetical protein